MPTRTMPAAATELWLGPKRSEVIDASSETACTNGASLSDATAGAGRGVAGAKVRGRAKSGGVKTQPEAASATAKRVLGIAGRVYLNEGGLK
mmetsp:Transcript_103848/g.292912  ORF Transcript_103848/g.292912 Transcript_103848/m.292912 type:complete len:92 (+) Transcript_103848:786-1061(+)